MDTIERPKTLEDLAKNLAIFNGDHLPPSMPHLEASEPYILDKDWPKQWPGTTLPGVYIFIDKANQILYVGKASCKSNLGLRLGAHFMYGPENKCERKGQYATMTDPALVTSVVTIPIYDLERFFEADALEAFLIRKLDPPFNTNGHSVAEAT
jgi:hypothetical protein